MRSVRRQRFDHRGNMGERTQTRRSGFSLAVVLAGALAVAACGGDDDDDAADTAAPATAAETTAAAPETTPAETTPAETTPAETTPAETTPAEPAEPTGDPIKIMVTGTIESAAFSLPTIPLGAQIAVDEINAAGGVNGSPLELLVCNDELDPNLATSCIQEAVKEGAVALVGGLSVFEPIVFPLLANEGIAWVGAATSSDFTTPILFPVGADGATAFSGIGAAAIESGCTNPATVISFTGSPANAAALKAGIESSGGTVAVELQTTPGPDLAPLVESAIAAGADCIASGVSPAETGALVAAIAGRLPLITLDGPLPEVLAAALGSAADGVKLVSGFRLPAAGDPNVLALAEISAAINPDVGVDHFWITGYSAVKIVAEVLAGADEASAAAVLEGLPNITDFDTGFGAIIDFSTPNSVPGFARVFNTELYLWELKDGKYTLVQDETLDMQPAIELLGQ